MEKIFHHGIKIDPSSFGRIQSKLDQIDQIARAALLKAPNHKTNMDDLPHIHPLKSEIAEVIADHASLKPNEKCLKVKVDSKEMLVIYDSNALEIVGAGK